MSPRDEAEIRRLRAQTREAEPERLQRIRLMVRDGKPVDRGHRVRATSAEWSERGDPEPLAATPRLEASEPPAKPSAWRRVAQAGAVLSIGIMCLEVSGIWSIPLLRNVLVLAACGWAAWRIVNLADGPDTAGR